MKNLLSKLAMAALLLIFSAGISSVAYAYDEADITSVNEQYLSSWNSTDFSQYLNDDTVDAASLEDFTNWQALKEELGTFKEAQETVVSEADGVITAVTAAVYEKGTLAFTITYDTATVEAYGAPYGAIAIDAVKAENSGISFPEIPKSLATFLMILGILFIILIVIAIIVIMVRYLSGGFENKKAEPAVGGNQAEALAVPAGGQNLVNDAQLVAVITAAIMAFESENHAPGGLVVRSIRRRK